MKPIACLSVVAFALVALACGGVAPLKGPNLSPPADPERGVREVPAEPTAQPKKIPTDLSKKSVMAGDVMIRLVSTKTTKVKIGGFRGGESKEPLFRVELEIVNRHALRKIEYRGWHNDNSFDYVLASLADEYGNKYKAITFGFTSGVEGQLIRESIYPGKSVTDVLVFEAPVDAAKELRLTLPGNNFGGEGELVVIVPREYGR